MRGNSKIAPFFAGLPPVFYHFLGEKPPRPQDSIIKSKNVKQAGEYRETRCIKAFVRKQETILVLLPLEKGFFYQ